MKNRLVLLILIFLANTCAAQIGREVTSLSDTGYTFPPDTTPNIYRILMEEYTGHLCGNGPAADSILYNSIVPRYGDTIITIGVHAGIFADTCPVGLACGGNPAGSFTEDFRTLDGDNWNTFFSITAYPEAMINRKDYPLGNQGKTTNVWNSQIANIIQNAPKVKIRVHAEYNPITRQLNTYSETNFLARLSGNYKLNVILTEDSIISWQVHNGAVIVYDSTYIHRDVMRGSLNGPFGEQVNVDTATLAGTLIQKNYSATLAQEWDVNYIRVVAFLYDDSTKEILNVARDNNFMFVTGIDEMVSINSIGIFPNPAGVSSILRLNTQLKEGEIIIYDLLGQERLKQELKGTEINIESLQRGIYIVCVRKADREYTQKLIIE